MAFFNDLTTSLKQKWLQFFQVNRSWLARHMDMQSVSTPDGGRRPPSYLILGVANALEPQLAELMLPFTKLNPDVDALIDALELHFDPELMRGFPSHTAANLEEPRYESLESDAAPAPMPQPTYNVTVVETLTELEPDQMIGMSLNDIANEQVMLVTSDDESIMVLNIVEPDQANGMLLDEPDESIVVLNVLEPDQLNGMLLDDSEESLMMLNVLDPDQENGMALDDSEESLMMLNILDPDQENGMAFDAIANDEAVAETDDESIGIMNVDELDELSNMLLDDTDSELMEADDRVAEPSAAQPDMFGDMSLDDMADFTVSFESDDDLKTPRAAQTDEADNVLLDMWGEEKLPGSDADEKQSEHDQEISRLFPNL